MDVWFLVQSLAATLVTRVAFRLYSNLLTIAWILTKLCSMYDVYLFDMLFTKFLLIQILEILMVNKLFTLIA